MIRILCAIFWVFTTSFDATASFRDNVVERHLPFEKHQVKSSALSETLDIYVQLPFKYESEFNQEQRYPVLYVLDAPVGLPLISGVLAPLNGHNTAPQMIVVGISSSNRARDFTPTLDANYEEQSGGADKYLAFIEQDVIPYIENNFRTDKFRILSGHSYGGLLVAHSFHKKPNLFQAHFANSPSLFWQGGQTVKDIIAFVKSHPTHKNYLYMNIGNEGNPESESPEGAQMLEGLQSIERTLTSLKPQHLRYTFEYYRNQPHQTTQIYGAIGALRGLYPQWSIPYTTSVEGYSSVLAHFKQLSELYGYEIQPKAWQIYDEGIAQLTYLENPAEAVKFFNHNINRDPSTYSSRARIVDAFISLGKQRSALEHLNVLLQREDLSDDERQDLTAKKSNVSEIQRQN